MLRCPVCKQSLILSHDGATCLNSHHFDRSKQGYLHLLTTNKKKTGDNKEMSVARHDFLSAGHYSFLVDYLLKAIGSTDSLVDLGCGEGYYTSQFNEVATDVIGFDLSKESLKMAAKQDKQATYVVASIANLPLFDESVDVVTKLFAPTFLDEIIRILKPGGTLVCVDVGVKHLVELKEVIYESVKLNTTQLINDSRLQLLHSEEITQRELLDNEHLRNLFTMTPYRFKTRLEDFNKLLKVEALEMTFSFHVHVYQKASS